MSKAVGAAVVLGVLAVVAPQAVAAPIVSLSSSSDLAHLQIGDEVTLDVYLSGLPVPNTGPFADFIFRLYTEVLFPASIFNPVSGPTPGDVLPLPTQQANFLALSSLTDGSALGIFDEAQGPAPGGAISQNGVYFSFTLVATAAGSGTLHFDPTDTRYVSTSSHFAFAPLPTGGPLAFTVTADTTAVPEPSVLLLIASGLGLGAVARRRRLTRADRLTAISFASLNVKSRIRRPTESQN